MEDEEALESGTLVSQLPDPVQNEVDDLLADGVMAARVVVGGVFLPRDQLLRVEQLTIDPIANLVCGIKSEMKIISNINQSVYVLSRN